MTIAIEVGGSHTGEPSIRKVNQRCPESPVAAAEGDSNGRKSAASHDVSGTIPVEVSDRGKTVANSVGDSWGEAAISATAQHVEVASTDNDIEPPVMI